MQHASAKKLADNSGWHWVDTHTEDCRVRKCAPHATQEAAELCQYEDELSKFREIEFVAERPCVECLPVKNYTCLALAMGHYMASPIHLCVAHRTIDILRKHVQPSTSRGQA